MHLFERLSFKALLFKDKIRCPLCEKIHQDPSGGTDVCMGDVTFEHVCDECVGRIASRTFLDDHEAARKFLQYLMGLAR